MSPQPKFQNHSRINRILDTLRSDFVVVGKNRVRGWHAWLVIGLVAGILTGIVLVANRSGEFEPSVAAPPSQKAPALTASAISDSQIDLSWNDPNQNETGYAIERSLFPGSGYSEIARVPQDTTIYNNKNLAAQTTYYYRLRAYKQQGKTTDYSPYSNIASETTFLTSDTTPPSVSITAPLNGATISGIIPIKANASDNVGVIGVQFKLDGSNLGLEDATAPYEISWDTTAAANGSHTLSATARDAAGNRATSISITVTASNLVVEKFTKGVFSLTGSEENPSSKVWSNPNISGVVIRTAWGSIEKSEGVYDWAYIDTQITAAKAVGKKLAIHIKTGTTKINALPSWLLTGYPAMQRFSYLDSGFGVGDRVKTTAVLDVRATPSVFGTLLGTQPMGSLGTIIGGPISADGYKWWNIDYDNAPDGWGIQDYLVTPIVFAAPWDPTYLQKLTNFINAFGARYKNESAIAYLRLGGGQSILSGWEEKDTIYESTGVTPVSWQSAGFTSDRLLSSAKTTIDVYMSALPITPLWDEPETIKSWKEIGAASRTSVSEAITNYGRVTYSDRYGVWREDLHACTATNPPSGQSGYLDLFKILWDNPGHNGAQMVWNVQDGTQDVPSSFSMNPQNCVVDTNGDLHIDKVDVLKKAVDNAIAYQMPYVEIYQADVIDSALQEVLQYAKQKLGGQ